MVFKATFNNNLVISWRSVLLVKETEVTGEKKTVMEAFNKLVKCQFEQVEKLLTWYQSPTYCRCGSRILR
jgi:uncharacterized protein (DUF1330 family)